MPLQPFAMPSWAHSLHAKAANDTSTTVNTEVPVAFKATACGADPTGALDATAPLQHCLDAAVSSPGFAVVDLEGGIYRLDNEIIINGTLASETNGPRAGTSVQLIHGTLNASSLFPANLHLLHLLDTSSVVLNGLRIQVNRRGGGIRLDSARQTSVTSVFVLGYSTTGLWATCASDNASSPAGCYGPGKIPGDELLVQQSWFGEFNYEDPPPNTGGLGTGTAIETNYGDNIFANILLFCSLRGLFMGPGGTEALVTGVHFWLTACGQPDGTTTGAIMGWGRIRVFNCQFDKGNQLFVEDADGLIATGSTFHGGAGGIKLAFSGRQSPPVLRNVVIRNNYFRHFASSAYDARFFVNGNTDGLLLNGTDISDNMFSNASAAKSTKANLRTAPQGKGLDVVNADVSAQLLFPTAAFYDVQYSVQAGCAVPAHHLLPQTKSGLVSVQFAGVLECDVVLRVRVDQSTPATDGAWCDSC